MKPAIESTEAIDLGSLEVKSRSKKLVDELRDYRKRMRELGRVPVFRVRHPDYVLLRDTAKRLAGVDSFGELRLDGIVV